jgi:hypothetical protein
MTEPVIDGDGANVAHRARADGMTKTTPIEPAREVDSARYARARRDTPRDEMLTAEEHALRNQGALPGDARDELRRPVPKAELDWDARLREWLHGMLAIERIQVLNIRPGDTLVVTVYDATSPDLIDNVRQHTQTVAKAVGIDPDRVLIIAGSAEVKVVRTDARLETVSFDDEPGPHGGTVSVEGTDDV